MLNEYCHKYVWDTRVDHNSKEKVFREAWKKMQFFFVWNNSIMHRLERFQRSKEYI